MGEQMGEQSRIVIVTRDTCRYLLQTSLKLYVKVYISKLELSLTSMYSCTHPKNTRGKLLFQKIVSQLPIFYQKLAKLLFYYFARQ